MEIRFTSIEKKQDEYIYIYEALVLSRYKRTTLFLGIAGVIGSVTLVKENGWLILIPFWLAIYAISTLLNWYFKKQALKNSKACMIQFKSHIPHYSFQDVIWMFKCQGKELLYEDMIYDATYEWSEEIDLKIGKFSVVRTNRFKTSAEVFDRACEEQIQLEKEWSVTTGIDYPDLGMPLR